MTNIEWTDETWNPIAGCSRISAGCENCYAEKMTKRLEAMGSAKYAGLLNQHGRFNGETRFDGNALMLPLKRKKPTRYFVNSMSDLFHESVPDAVIQRIFAVMASAPQHTFQILTKRASRMRDFVGYSQQHHRVKIAGIMKGNHLMCIADQYLYEWPLKNVWLGVSVENQKAADERIPLLIDMPAAVRFLSCEPLIERVNLEHIDADAHGHTNFCQINALTGKHTDMGRFCADLPSIDWVIVGGESGSGARPCNIDWIRSIVRQCQAADVPVFVKQLGTGQVENGVHKQPTDGGPSPEYDQFWYEHKKGADMNEWPQDIRVRQFPKN